MSLADRAKTICHFCHQYIIAGTCWFGGYSFTPIKETDELGFQKRLLMYKRSLSVVCLQAKKVFFVRTLLAQKSFECPCDEGLIQNNIFSSWEASPKVCNDFVEQT